MVRWTASRTSWQQAIRHPEFSATTEISPARGSSAGPEIDHGTSQSLGLFEGDEGSGPFDDGDPWAEEPFDRIRLDVLAERAEVTVPTIVRRFGGKAGVIAALVERELSVLLATRRTGVKHSTPRVIGDLVDHYEAYGAMILKMYAEAPMITGLPALAGRARAQHLQWCRDTFTDRLPPSEPITTARRLAQITALCDATTWRILRHDAGLQPAQIRVALLELFEPLLDPLLDPNGRSRG